MIAPLSAVSRRVLLLTRSVRSTSASGCSPYATAGPSCSHGEEIFEVTFGSARWHTATPKVSTSLNVRTTNLGQKRYSKAYSCPLHRYAPILSSVLLRWCVNSCRRRQLNSSSVLRFSSILCLSWPGLTTPQPWLPREGLIRSTISSICIRS